MSVTTELEELITAYIDTHGSALMALLPGGLFHEDDIPETAPPLEYGGWDWVSEEEVGTASDEVDRNVIQFIFYGNNRRELDIIRDTCFCVLDSTRFKKDIGFNIELFKYRAAPGFKAMKNFDQKKDRYSKFVAMAQFWMWAQKTYTIIQ